MNCDGAAQIFLGFEISSFFDLVGKVEVIPADDAVFDQPVTAFGNFLFFFFNLGKPTWISNGGFGKYMLLGLITYGLFALYVFLTAGIYQSNCDPSRDIIIVFLIPIDIWIDRYGRYNLPCDA